MSSFTWTPSLTEKFIEVRLKNDHLFQRKFRSWSSFKKILIGEGFPKNISTRMISKKWGNLYHDYQNALSNKAKTYKYYEIFDKYKQKPSPMNRFRNWSTEWIKKLIEIRIEHENIFKTNSENVNQYEENWSLIERKIRDSGLPVECSVRRMDQIWETLLKKFKLKYFKKEDVKESWTYYNLFKCYFEKYHLGETNYDFADSDDDMEPLSTLKNNKIKNEVDYSVLNSEAHECHDDFKWTSEWTESFIHLRFQNDNLFQKKRNSWNDFHKLMISNGFPETLTVQNVRKKWSCIMESYRKAVLLNKKNWIHSKLLQKYLENDKFDIFKDWPEEWIKCLIKLRIKNNKFFVGSLVDHDRKWKLLEFELRKAGLPNQCILRNIHFIWLSLVKKFKLIYKKKKNITPETTWPYYQHMKEYFIKCNPKFFSQNESIKCKNDDESDREISQEYPNTEEQHFVAVKKEFLNYPCRCCLQSSDQVVSLYEYFDNMPIVHRFTECTSISIEENTNYPYHLCHPCFNQLNIAYEFRKKCEHSENVLKSHTFTVNELNDENVSKSHSNTIDQLKVENLEAEPSNIIAEFNFSDDIINTHYSSDDEDKKIVKPKPKKKTSGKVISSNKKPRPQSKNVITIPMKTESGEIILKKKYIQIRQKKVCEICGKSSINMNEHMRGHSNEKTFKCEICLKTFRYRTGYTTHLKIHSKTPLQVCQVCGKEFYRNRSYKRHLIYHANERKFSCETCGKSFNTNEILRIHIRSHTGERPYACQICSKTFISKGCVDRHQKVHNKQMLKQNQVGSSAVEDLQSGDTLVGHT